MGYTAAGQIVVWQGGSLWAGRAAMTTDVHSHHAIQITLGLDGGFRLSGPEAGFGAETVAAVVAADKPHAFSVDATVALIFVEPESLQGRAISRLCGEAAIVAIDPELLGHTAAGLLEAIRGRNGAEMESAARAVVARLGGPGSPRDRPDARVARVIGMLGLRLDDPPRLEEAAHLAKLSPDRFRHLFVEETGLQYRSYLLWLRLGRAVAAFAKGQSLTEAAHAAGFSDSAHLSRTFRRTFGLMPSSLRVE
ncbi:helix-turn-helix transcriptional regulator [Neoroseomonas soli]|uniref:Helix-turn-helix transcriptional regulator n=1 Tax=Neoroseomonas soli TaxID=1081025 RepID=A0A9X9X1Q9_9PROT|nr:AraC family transcriptional regulator [Neoroseomonas soli]MBR0673338.1 helix-turn-helix transcriptional regulator [Neoroseomonas soli]